MNLVLNDLLSIRDRVDFLEFTLTKMSVKEKCNLIKEYDPSIDLRYAKSEELTKVIRCILADKNVEYIPVSQKRLVAQRNEVTYVESIVKTDTFHTDLCEKQLPF